MPHVEAADLPALEPTDNDLIDLLTLPWDDTQGHLERLLAEAGLIELRRQISDVHVPPDTGADLAPVAELPTLTARYDVPERRDAA